MTFWGAEVKSGKALPFVPPPESARLHVSQATLAPDAPKNEKVAVKVKVGDDEIFICSLREGGQESVSLDLNFDSYAEFSLAGPDAASVHLAGYVFEEEDEEEYDDEDEDDEAIEVPPGMEDLDELDDADKQKFLEFLSKHQGQGAYLDSDEDDSDEESETEDDDDDDDEIGLIEATRGRKGKGKSGVIIEDITDLKPETTEVVLDDGKANDAVAKPNTEITETTTVTTVVETPQLTKDKKKGSKKSKKDEAKALEAMEVEEEGDTGDEEIELGEDDTEDEDSDDEDEDEDSEDDAEEAEEADVVEEQVPATKGSKKRKGEPKEVSEPKKSKAAEKTKQAATIQANGTSAGGAKSKKDVKTYPNGLIVENVHYGNPTGKIAKPGKKIVVKYVGKLAKTGKVFDQTQGKKTFAFRLGVGEVIKGWDQCLPNMRVGDKRRLTVPPVMGYGASGVKGVIPGNATLIFDVELCDVKG